MWKEFCHCLKIQYCRTLLIMPDIMAAVFLKQLKLDSMNFSFTQKVICKEIVGSDFTYWISGL